MMRLKDSMDGVFEYSQNSYGKHNQQGDGIAW